jgi:hypothetical protein
MHWTKYFLDGSIVREPMSWSSTSLTGINRVSYEEGSFVCALEGAGLNFWQSDTFIVIMDSGETKPVLTTRRIQVQIPPLKEIMISVMRPNDQSIVFDFNKSAVSANAPKMVLTKESGNWLTLEVNPGTLSYRYFIAKDKI